AQAVNETWLKRCDHGVLFTDAPFAKEKNIPYRTLFAGIPDTYDILFHKSRFAFYYISEIMRADFDWIVQANDDTYMIVENLRTYLRTLDPNLPYYLGFRLKPYLPNRYNQGGGYVLSRKALKLFADHAYNNTICSFEVEDVAIGRYRQTNIKSNSICCYSGQQRFNGDHPSRMLLGRANAGIWLVDPLTTGYEGIARDAISFHHLSATELRLFETLL
ncbi:hypothetical protein PMAYCL1PPCAC_32982, partial [Pristionchus mayeri]